MLYQKTLVVPANTPITALVEEALELPIGVSTRREVVFHDGCEGLVHIRVFHSDWQIMPWTREEWLEASGNVVVDESPYPISSAPLLFTISGYNTDTANDHTVQLRVILREGETEDFLELERFLDALRGL